MSLSDRLAGLAFRAGRPASPELRTPVPTGLQPNIPYSGPRASSGFTRVDFNSDYQQDQLIRKFYYESIWVYRGIRTIADSLGSLAWRVGNDPDHPASYNKNAPMAKLLGPTGDGPNDQMSSAQLWKYSIVSYMVTGAFAWEKVRDRQGNVIGYWALQTPKLRPQMSKQGNYYFDSYLYGHGVEERRLRRDDVVYVYRPALYDPRMAESPLSAAGLVIETDKMLHLMDYSTAKRGGPALVIETDQFDTPEHFEAFKDDFVDNFGGASNAGKPFFVERSEDTAETNSKQPSVGITTVGYNAKDMLMVDQKKAGKEDILAALGVPISMVGVTGEVAFQNGGWDRRNFWNETIKPLMDSITDGVNHQTVGDYAREQKGWFDSTDVAELRPLPPLTPEQAVAAYDKNLITDDEYREFIGLDPIPESEKVVPVVPDELAAHTGLGADEQATESDVKGKTDVLPTSKQQQVGTKLPTVPKGFAAARQERRAKVLFATPDACPICKSFDGKGRGRYKYLLPHPNCNCDIEDLKRAHALRQAMETQDSFLYGEMSRALLAIKDGSRGGKAQAAFRADPMSAVDYEKWRQRADEVYRGNLLQLGHWDDYQEVANERLSYIITDLESNGVLSNETEGQTNDA